MTEKVKVKLINNHGQWLNKELGVSFWTLFFPAPYAAYHRDWQYCKFFLIIDTIAIFNYDALAGRMPLMFTILLLCKIGLSLYFCMHYNRLCLDNLMQQGFAPAGNDDASKINDFYVRYDMQSQSAYQIYPDLHRLPEIKQDKPYLIIVSIFVYYSGLSSIIGYFFPKLTAQTLASLSHISNTITTLAG